MDVGFVGGGLMVSGPLAGIPSVGKTEVKSYHWRNLVAHIQHITRPNAVGCRKRETIEHIVFIRINPTGIGRSIEALQTQLHDNRHFTDAILQLLKRRNAITKISQFCIRGCR